MSPRKSRTTTGGGLVAWRRQGIIGVNNAKLRVELDSKRGTLRSVELDNTDRQNKRLVQENTAPLLFASVLESPGWDGVSDHAPGRHVKAACRAESSEVFELPGRVMTETTGMLSFGKNDGIHFRIRLEVKEGSRFIKAALSLTPRGAFKDRYIREIGLALPLALNLRKRVVQAGDQGLLWDTRHRYQFHTRIWSFLSQPEHNWWRRFYVDQKTDHNYVLWRGEAADTAPLEVFRGRRAPGWMSLYDETGGALFAYRGLAERAPKCLYADAAGGGRAVVYLHAPTHTAIHPKDERAARSLFGAEHEIGWYFFDNLGAAGRPEQEAARAWGYPELAPAEKFGPRDWAGQEAGDWHAGSARDTDSPYVFGGLPLPRGSIASVDQTRLFVQGKETVAQKRPLAFWPDGSVKWIELVFPLKPSRSERSQGTGDGDEAHFHVSLRNAATVPCTLLYGKRVTQAAPKTEIAAARQGDRICLDTGALKLTLGRGKRWLASAALNGIEMLRDDGKPQAYVDFLRPKEYVAATTHADGRLDSGPVRIDTVELQESGPLRAVVRLEGMAEAKEPARVTIRLEVFAGRSFVRLLHTVEFLHKDPREVFVRRMGLRLPLALSPRGLIATAGGQRSAVRIPKSERAGLRQTCQASYEVWNRREKARHPEIVESDLRSRGWLDLAGRQGGVAVMLRDMWQEFPKELLADAADPAVAIEFWPASAPLMDVRRYSNYPHRSQGETAPEDPRWVFDAYYKKEPFVGISKTHEAMLFFHGADLAPEGVDAVAADLNSRPLVYAGWDWYAKTRMTMPQAPADARSHARFLRNMRNVADWFLFHQKAWGWYGMWNYGDIQHLFRRGYGCILTPESLERALKLPPADRPAEDMRRLPWQCRQDYFTQQDWAFDNGRWGWTNTEGLPNLFMSQEYLRSGRRDLFFFMEACARHVRDVDARHSGMHFGKGTRHGVQHWSCGDHEERQTTFTELRFHYLLTGDRRTFEWNEQLTRDWYLKGTCSYMAGHAARSYGLFTRWEWTGDAEMGDIVKRYMHAFAQPEGIGINPLVEFPSVKMLQAVSQKSDERVFRPKGVFASFFHNFGAMHAILEYYYLTGDARLKEAVIETARRNLDKPWHERYPYQKAIAFAARHASDPEPFRRCLREWAAGPGWRQVYQQVPESRAHWTGPSAFFAGDTMGEKFWYADAHYVMGALNAEPALPPGVEAERLFLENRPTETPSRLPRESWQSEYDRPEFAEYIREPFASTE